MKTDKKNIFVDEDTLPPDEFSPENTRVRISMMVPGDILKHYKTLAAETKRPYQTLMQEALRQAMAKKGKPETNRPLLSFKELEMLIKKAVVPAVRKELKKAAS